MTTYDTIHTDTHTQRNETSSNTLKMKKTEDGIRAFFHFISNYHSIYDYYLGLCLRLLPKQNIHSRLSEVEVERHYLQVNSAYPSKCIMFCDKLSPSSRIMFECEFV